MARTGKIFSAHDKGDLDYLAMCIKAINSKQEDIRKIARQKLASLPEGGIINLLCAQSPDNAVKDTVEKIKQFCREDKEMQAVWEQKLKTKSYISTKTLNRDGNSISIFDHFLGDTCHSAFMDDTVDRQDRSRAVLLAADYYNYHALLVKCESILTILRNQPTSISKHQKVFNSTINALSNVFWSLGHLQAGCMMHQFKKIYKNDATTAKATDDLMMREFTKAEALIEKDESKALYSAVRSEKPLSEFLLQVFGVDSIVKVKTKLENNYTAVVVAINQNAAYLDMIREVAQALDVKDNKSEETTAEEESKVAALEAQVQSNIKKTAELGKLLKRFSLNKDKELPAPVQSNVTQKRGGMENN